MKKVMKKIVVILLIFVDVLAFSQFHKTYDWSNQVVIEKNIDTVFHKSSIGLINKYIVEYYVENDSLKNTFNKFLTRHVKLKILDLDGVDYHNVLYVPMYNSVSLIDLKVRVIDSTGNIKNLDNSNLVELDDDDGDSNFKIYKLTDIKVNSILEYIYTTKQKNEIHGSQILQEEYFNVRTEFILIPGKYKSKVKAYNTNTTFNTALIDEIPIKKITLNNLKSYSKEEYSAGLANRVDIAYQCYPDSEVKSHNEFWSNITNRIHAMAFPSTISKELISLNDLIFQKKSNYTLFEKINLIDNHIKINFKITKNGNSESSNLDYILKNKTGSNIGIIELYSSLLTYNSVNYELLITSNRYFNKFDPDFFNPDNLREILFYFPEERKYIIPDKSDYRVSEAPQHILGNYGIYMERNKDYYFSEIIENDKKYSRINRSIEVDFKKMKKVLIKETQKFTGYWAVTNRAAINLYNSYDQSAFKDYLTTTGLEGKEIIEYSIENKNIYQSSYNKPFIVNSIVSSDSLINKQVVYTTDEKSKIYKFKLGSLIGVQSELYNDKARVNPIEIKYPNFYDYIIRVNIPRGYKVEGLDKININKSYTSSGNIIAKFESKFSVEKDMLIISIEEYYKSLKYSKAKYQDFREVINAAADFNKLEITFIKN
jgi:hypothetical protein